MHLMNSPLSDTVSPGVTMRRARFAGRMSVSPSISTPPSESSDEVSRYGGAGGAGARIVIAMV